MKIAPENYKRGMAYLNANFPFFTVMVTNLGRPVINVNVLGKDQNGDPIYEVPTLQVQRRLDEEKFELAVNERFLDNLTDAEVAGTLAHESFHILFSHLSEQVTDKATEKAKEFYPDGSEHQIKDMAQKMVVLAHECVCNDNVINEGFDLPDLRKPNPKTGELEGGPFFGPDVVGRSVAYYTTDEVIDLFKKPGEKDSGDGNKSGEILDKMGGGGNEHFVLVDEDDLKDLQDAISKGIRHAVYEGKLDPKDIQSDDIKNILKIRPKSKRAGATNSKIQRQFEKAGLSVNWFKYLRRLDPSAFRDGGNAGDWKASWHRPRKKIAWMADPTRSGPRVNLPVQKPRFNANNIGALKPHIVLALDFSGSIPPEMQTVMGNLARMVPDSIDVNCCTFSTEYVPFDHKLDQQEVASGGTDFSAIQNFIDSLNLKRQPHVVVITDGQAQFSRNAPTQEALDNKWNWLLINRNDAVYAGNVPTNTVEFLDDYLSDK